MTQCKTIGCSSTALPEDDYCVGCLTGAPKTRTLSTPSKDTSSGGDNDYWLAEIRHPKRLDPYTAECEDLIETLGMSFQEGEAFKAIWRKCKARMGDGKPGDSALRNAEKVHHFGGRMVAMERQKLECTS